MNRHDNCQSGIFSFSNLYSTTLKEYICLTSIYRSAREDSKSSSDTLSIQSVKRSYVDLTGDDDIIDEPEEKKINVTRLKTSFDRHHDIVDQRDQHKKRRVISTITNPLSSRPDDIADQPKSKRVAGPVNNHRWSDSDDELQTSEVELFSARNAAKGE